MGGTLKIQKYSDTAFGILKLSNPITKTECVCRVDQHNHVQRKRDQRRSAYAYIIILKWSTLFLSVHNHMSILMKVTSPLHIYSFVISHQRQLCRPLLFHSFPVKKNDWQQVYPKSYIFNWVNKQDNSNSSEDGILLLLPSCEWENNWHWGHLPVVTICTQNGNTDIAMALSTCGYTLSTRCITRVRAPSTW